ncbi:MAG: hypothetical protein JWQ94_1722 [Tardiphaga sp.]|jgi:hypothetical protein|nr:hypothetical protein [Tardiphaga sp.]
MSWHLSHRRPIGATASPARSGQVHPGAIILALTLTGCGTASMTRSGSLSSYDNMTASDGMLTKSLIHVAKDQVLAAKTVRISATVFSASASPALTEKQRVLVANTVNRSLCTGLSDRFEVVGVDQPADLTVHAVVTEAAATNEFAAGASKVASIVPMALGSPVPVPRLPIGLGSLTLEAEAVDRNGKQQAAMIWARGADSFTTSPTVSKAGDAYDLANTFGADFSQLLVSGATPFGTTPSAPSLQKINATFGGKQKYVACEAYGRAPGVGGMIAGRVGLPPEWSDDGAKRD